MAPSLSSLLSISVYYGKQSTIGNVVLRSVGSSLNVTVTSIILSSTKSSIECFGETSVKSGERVTCRWWQKILMRILLFPSYANALLGEVLSTSGERQVATITYQFRQVFSVI